MRRLGQGTGISIARIAVLAFLSGALLLFALAAIRLRGPMQRVPASLLPMAAAVSLLAAVTLYLLRYLDPALLLPYYQRLSVPLTYVLLLSLQAFGVLLIPRFKGATDAALPILANLPRAGFAWLILLLVLGFVALTGLGTTPDPAYWGEPGVPILGWQLAIAILCGILTLLLCSRLGAWSKLDMAIAAAVWLVAVTAWLLVPLDVLQNSFYAPIRPPAYVPFPNSDAGYYNSMAHSLLIGYPYLGEIPSRPLYIVLLTGLHLLFGERYDLIIIAQTLILATIPVLLFWLGSAIHSRPAGVIAALAAIGREWTSLMASSATRVSNSKMLLVDLPTLLAMLLCCLLVLRWLQRKDARSAAFAGGAFALLLLLRTQTLALLPVLLLFAALAFGLRRRATFVQLAVFVAALALALAPWLIHNYLTTGHVALDAQFQYRIIASQYRYTGNLDIQNVDLAGKSVVGILTTFALKDPAFVFGFVANHALATQVSSLLALPRFYAAQGLLAGVDPYWVAWNGKLTLSNLVLVVIYLGIIGLGIACAWARLRWAGILPLGISLGYSLANGIARFSGWRYDLPADWTAYFYFAVGTAEILLLGAAIFGARLTAAGPPHGSPGKPSPAPELRAVLPILATLALIGALPWFAARMAAPRYVWATPQALESRLAASPAVRLAGVTTDQIATASHLPGAVMQVGRVLYPRFFSRGTGLASAHPWPAYAPRDYPRLGFLLLNATRQDVLLPTRDIPSALEHSSDAIVVGCQRADYIEARLVFLPETDVAIQVAPLADPCE